MGGDGGGQVAAAGQKFSQKQRQAKQTRTFCGPHSVSHFPLNVGGRPKGNYVNMALMHATRPSPSASSCVYNLISNNARGCVCLCVCLRLFLCCVKCCANEIPPTILRSNAQQHSRRLICFHTNTNTLDTHTHTRA